MIKCNLCGNGNAKLKYSLELCQIYKCPNCDLVFTDQDSLKYKQGKDMYSKDYFQITHPNFFKESGIDYAKYLKKSRKLQTFLKEAKTLRKYKQGGVLLDIGCATGVFLDMARKEGFDVYGVELSDYAAKYAKENFNLNIFNGKLEESKFKKGMFDVITMWDFFEHVPNPSKILSKAKELLKEDGIIVIQTVNDDCFMCNMADKVYKLSNGLISKPVSLVHPIHHITHFSKKTLFKMLYKHDLKPIHVKYSEIPLDNVEGGLLVKAAVAGIYTMAWFLNSPFEIKVIMRKLPSKLNK